MLVFCILVVEEDRVEFAHVEEHGLIQWFPVFIAFKFSFKLIVFKHIDRILWNLALDLLAPRFHIIFLLGTLYLVNEG